jgi:hypothetical protein
MDWKHDREMGFEEQFARREARAFRAAAHRNGLLAQWAARKMQLDPRESESYVQKMITGDVAHLRGRGVVDRVFQDLSAAGVTISEREVSTEFDRLDNEARSAPDAG